MTAGPFDRSWTLSAITVIGTTGLELNWFPSLMASSWPARRILSMRSWPDGSWVSVHATHALATDVTSELGWSSAMGSESMWFKLVAVMSMRGHAHWKPRVLLRRQSLGSSRRTARGTATSSPRMCSPASPCVEYGHDEAVAGGVNVDFDVYKIKTEITEHGATIDAGVGDGVP